MASPPLKNLIKKLKGQRAALESLIEAALYTDCGQKAFTMND
jgi:hypothetical protein